MVWGIAQGGGACTAARHARSLAHKVARHPHKVARRRERQLLLVGLQPAEEPAVAQGARAVLLPPLRDARPEGGLLRVVCKARSQRYTDYIDPLQAWQHVLQARARRYTHPLREWQQVLWVIGSSRQRYTHIRTEGVASPVVREWQQA